MPTSLRKLAIAGAAGVAVALAFAAPASACHAEPGIEKVCVTAEKAKVTWTIQANPGGATVTGASATIDGQPATLESSSTLVVNATLSQTTKLNAVLMVPKGKSAQLNVQLRWSNGETYNSATDSDQGRKAKYQTKLHGVDWTKCPAQSQSSSSAAGSSSAAASSSSSAAALPVTGTNVAMMAGGAVILVGAGVALFLAARRRRVRFTTA